MKRNILVKALRLQKAIEAFWNSPEGRNTTEQKFKAVWGGMLAAHFLSEYQDAESMIFGLDDENLDLFIEKF